MLIFKKDKIQLPRIALRKAEDVLGIEGIPDNEHFYVSNDVTLEHIREALIEAYMSGIIQANQWCNDSTIPKGQELVDDLIKRYNNRKVQIANENGDIIISQG